MNYRQFKKTKALIASFIAATVSLALVYDNMILALAGMAIGVGLLFFVKRQTKAVLVDERLQSIGNRAAYLTYKIFTFTIAFLSLFFVLIGRKAVPPQVSLENLGITFSYLALLSLALYSLSYKYLSKKYGESDDE